MTSLPVIDDLIDDFLNKIEKAPLRKTAIVYIHHPLQTSINVIKGIISLGANPSNIFVLGKHYSECASVVKQVRALGVYYQPCSVQIGLGRFSQNFIGDINWLWSNVLATIKEDVEEILVLDHGGCAITYTPSTIVQKYKIIGVEKTTGGLINFEAQGLQPFPIIGLANSAAKKIVESPLIAEAIMQKLLPLIPLKSEHKICGVVGYGAIGKAITNKLLAIGHKVIVYDSEPSQLQAAKEKNDLIITNDLTALIATSDYIFGCTGRDISTSLDHFKLSAKNKTLISCSSEDKEFLSLLRLIQQQDDQDRYIDPLSNIEYQTEMGATIKILRGGFPVNFDNSGESVPAMDIQLTRALVIGSILQSTEFFKRSHLLNKGNIYKLDPILQQYVINKWLRYQPTNRFSKKLIDKFQNIAWIAEHSGGYYESIGSFGSSFV